MDPIDSLKHAMTRGFLALTAEMLTLDSVRDLENATSFFVKCFPDELVRAGALGAWQLWAVDDAYVGNVPDCLSVKEFLAANLRQGTIL